MKYYQDKNKLYFTHPRADLVGLIADKRGLKVLELGAAGCDTLVELKNRGIADEVTGIELFDMPETNQQSELIDKLIIADIEKHEINLPDNYFDVIICADVLEHLVDPWATVRKLATYLKKEGTFILSIPNIQDILSLYKIAVRGDFRYNPQGGVLDKTHLRFFCKKNAIDLLKQGELKVERVYTNIKFEVPSSKRRIINQLTFGLFKRFLAVQYILIAKKDGHAKQNYL